RRAHSSHSSTEATSQTTRNVTALRVAPGDRCWFCGNGNRRLRVKQGTGCRGPASATRSIGGPVKKRDVLSETVWKPDFPDQWQRGRVRGHSPNRRKDRVCHHHSPVWIRTSRQVVCGKVFTIA